MNVNNTIKIWDDVSLRHVIRQAEYFVERLRDLDDVVLIDVGANSGAFFSHIQSKVKIKKAILFEPQEHLYYYLKDKYKNFPEVIVEKTALSDCSRSYVVNDDSFHWHIKAMSVSLDNTMDMNLGTSRIDYQENAPMQTKTLDEIFHKYNLSKVDAIKIDTETEDLLILQGMIQSINSLEQKPFIEFESNWRERHTRDEAIQLLKNFCEKTNYDYSEVDLDASYCSTPGPDCRISPISINK